MYHRVSQTLFRPEIPFKQLVFWLSDFSGVMLSAVSYGFTFMISHNFFSAGLGSQAR